jgi:hypothetical protein
MIHTTSTTSNATVNHSISSLNNKAIQLVQQGDGRNATKLFLHALSSLKAEVKQSSTKSYGAMGPVHGSGFLRVALPKSPTSISSMVTYDTLFALNPTSDPCAPTQRDGSTACLLYNMALSHQRRCVEQMSEQPNISKSNLKKSAATYYMAFAAAQHWKKHTTTAAHEGYSILTLAIVNNLLVIHHELGNMDKVTQFHGLLRNTLFRVRPINKEGDEIHSEELSLFAKNLQRCHNSDRTIQAPAATMSTLPNSIPCTTGTTSGEE